MHLHEDFLNRPKLQDLGRWYVTRFVKKVAKELPRGASILDAGAGECAYKRCFSHCSYKAVDLAIGEGKWNYHNLDYIAPLHSMPIADNAYDAVLCTQVLEHLEWPRECMAEFYRILKPGGRLFLTAPMAHPEHQVPYDFFRYTSYGLRSICEKAQFQDVQIVPFGGMWTRWAYELPRCIGCMPAFTNNSSRGAIAVLSLPLNWGLRLAILLLQSLFLRLENLDEKKNDPFGWGLVATK